MRTFELRQYTLRSKEELDVYMNQVYPAISIAFRYLGLIPTASGP